MCLVSIIVAPMKPSYWSSSTRDAVLLPGSAGGEVGAKPRVRDIDCSPAVVVGVRSWAGDHGHVWTQV